MQITTITAVVGKLNTNTVYHVGGNGPLFVDWPAESSFASLYQIVI